MNIVNVIPILVILSDQGINFDFDLDPIVDVIGDILTDGIILIMNVGGQIFWRFIPGHPTTVITSSMMPLIAVIIMLLGIKRVVYG